MAQSLLSREISALEALRGELVYCDRQLAEILPDTPAGVLTSIPGVGVATASYYGAALGDPWRFANASAAYRYSGSVARHLRVCRASPGPGPYQPGGCSRAAAGHDYARHLDGP